MSGKTLGDRIMLFVSFRHRQGETYTNEALIQRFREANPEFSHDEVGHEISSLLKTRRLKFGGKYNMIHPA